jgi:hypothetical protein
LAAGWLRFDKNHLDAWRERESSLRKISKIKTAAQFTPS